MPSDIYANIISLLRDTTDICLSGDKERIHKWLERLHEKEIACGLVQEANPPKPYLYIVQPKAQPKRRIRRARS